MASTGRDTYTKPHGEINPSPEMSTLKLCPGELGKQYYFLAFFVTAFFFARFAFFAFVAGFFLKPLLMAFSLLMFEAQYVRPITGSHRERFSPWVCMFGNPKAAL